MTLSSRLCEVTLNRDELIKQNEELQSKYNEQIQAKSIQSSDREQEELIQENAKLKKQVGMIHYIRL